MVEKLAAEARKEALAELSGWSEAEGRDAITRHLFSRISTKPSAS